MAKEINKTIVVKYHEEAIKIMEYTTALCGCCAYENYDQWYNKNEAYFVKSGMYIMEDLMRDSDNNSHKYCFTFNFEDQTQGVFTIYNYYTQKEVCVFRYIREDNNTFKPKIIIDRYDEMAWQNIGVFMNGEIEEKVGKVWKDFHRKYDDKPRKIYNREIKALNKVVDRMVAEFMCEHTVDFCYATMFYFSVQRPDNIKIEEYESTNPKEIETFVRSGKRKYYYSGYINLNETKIYKPIINDKLFKKKRGEYERHIEKWGVRGHYRTINGNKIWIEEFEKGEGRLEKRVYGTSPENEMNIIPKVFEVDIKIPINEPPLEKENIEINQEESSEKENIEINQEESRRIKENQEVEKIEPFTIEVTNLKPTIVEAQIFYINHSTAIVVPLIPPNTLTLTFHPKPSFWSRIKSMFKIFFKKKLNDKNNLFQYIKTKFMIKSKDIKLTKEELLIHKNQIDRMTEHTNKTVGGFTRYWCFNSDKTELIYKCSGDGNSFVANREGITNE